MVAQRTAKASWLRAQKLELTSAGSPTPRSCSRPLSPRTEVRREDPKGSDTVRRPPSVHEPKLAHSIQKETRVSLRIRIRLPTGRPAQADTYDRRESSAKHPTNQPGTHTSTGPRPRGFRQNITDTQPLTETAKASDTSRGVPQPAPVAATVRTRPCLSLIHMPPAPDVHRVFIRVGITASPLPYERSGTPACQVPYSRGDHQNRTPTMASRGSTRCRKFRHLAIRSG